ncbi:MAG TPA: GldG family protein, partial [Anaerolineales bacterium]|nr:GldG family protein [Anaerolineales bacterium]
MAANKNSAARFAVIGLIIAGLGCIATALLAIVQGTVALQLYTPPQPDLILRLIAISAVVLVLGLALYAILNPNGVRRFLSGRQARYGSNAIIMAVAFAAILILINWLVFQNPWSKDITEDQQHTLAPETIRALATLPDKVNAIAFFSAQTPRDTAKQLLDNFKSNSKGKFDYRFVDPNSDPVLAHQYSVTTDGKIVLVMGKTSETASFADETDVTQAMVRLINPQARTVYFLTGHGEPDINGSDSGALSRAKQTLESKNYTVKTLNLAAENKIPADAKALIEAGPANPMLDQEVSLIKDYLAKGGGFMLLQDPIPFTKFGTTADPMGDFIKSTWGITF